MAALEQDLNLDAASPLDRSKTGITLLSNAVMMLAVIAGCLVALWVVRPHGLGPDATFAFSAAHLAPAQLTTAWVQLGGGLGDAWNNASGLLTRAQYSLPMVAQVFASHTASLPVPASPPEPANLSGLADLFWNVASRLQAAFPSLPSHAAAPGPIATIETVNAAVAWLGQYNPIAYQMQERLRALPGYENGALAAVFWVLVLALAWLGLAQLRFVGEGIRRLRESNR